MVTASPREEAFRCLRPPAQPFGVKHFPQFVSCLDALPGNLDLIGMDYFFLKLGAGNVEAEARLGKAPPEAVVYFDPLDEAAYVAGQGKAQPREFWMRGHLHHHQLTIMVVIVGGKIWLLKPTGSVTFAPYSKDLTAKIMPVEILKLAWCKDVPPVLAGMGSSQRHGRRTFTRIEHWGNLKAIDFVLNRANSPAALKASHWLPKNQTAAQLLECLGSTELETLVGKLFEEKGCHVPAYLGGTLRDIDIFAWNETATDIAIGDIVIPPQSRFSIQVKTWQAIHCPSSVDCLIGLNAIRGPKTYDADWLLNRVQESPKTFAWMKRSLNWLPEHFRSQFGLQ